MRRFRLPSLFVAAATLMAGSACAQDADTDAKQAQWDAYLDGVGASLRVSGAPRDWALAATMYRKDAEPVPDAAVLLGNAAKAAPDDALVQWTYLTHQARSPGACGRDGPDPERLRRLVAREPDNAATWTLLAAEALDAGDDDGADRAFERAVAASTFDDYLSASIDAWLVVFRRRPPPFPDPTFAETYPQPRDIAPDALAFGSAMAQGTSPVVSRMTVVFKACDASLGAARDVRRYAYCADLGHRMLGAKTGITQLLGHALIEKSGLQTDAEATARAELREIYDRIRDLDAQLADAAEVATILDDWRSTGGDETEVWRRRLQRAGLLVIPPLP
jgi:hypothetical protein